MPHESQISAGADPAGRAARRARIQRDAALDRVGSITRKIAVGSIAAAVAIGIYVSRALPGHSARPTTTGSASDITGGTSGAPVSSSGVSGGSSAGAGGSSGTLTQPTSPPSQTQQQAPVVSGST